MNILRSLFRILVLSALLTGAGAFAEKMPTKRVPVFKGDHVPEKEATEPPRETRHVPPKYPASMLRAGIEGWVMLAFIVDAEGRPTEVQAIESSHPDFEAAAVEAARQWEFTPGRKAGKTVRVAVQRRVVFTLGE